MGSKAFGEQNPTLGEDAVSWQTWSDGAAGIPDVDGNADWGKLKLDLLGEEGRSAVYDLGSAVTRLFTLTENRYGTGAESATLQIRGDTTSFTQDAISPAWSDYTAPISRTWRYIQIREVTGIRFGMWIWPHYYHTKAQIDNIIAYSVAHGITDLYPSAIDWDVNPYRVLGDSTLATITTERADGVYPLTYLIAQANANGIRVHAWMVIYIWEYWGTASSLLLSPLAENATNHDQDSGGSILNFAEAAPRGTVEDFIADFVTENPGLAGINLDYIRTDGVVTDIVNADITAFVSELRAKIPNTELSFCSLSNLAASTTYHQDGATWLSSNYVDTLIAMGYELAYGTKKEYWDTCDFTGKKLMVGQATQVYMENPSDFRAGLIRYRDLGYENFNFFVWDDNVDASGYSDALDDFHDGSIDANTTMGAITKIVVTPATSFAITIGGTAYTTNYADVVDHTTSGALKAHVEAAEGADRPFIHYMRPTTTTVKIVVGDWEP